MKPGDVDLADPNNVVRYGGAPVDYFAVLRREDPVHWNELTEAGRQEVPTLKRGFWVLTRYDDIVRASKDHAYFSSHIGGPVLWDLEEVEGALETQRAGMMGMDPPDHSRYRKLVAPPFTPRSIAKLEPVIQKKATEIVDAVASRGRCDFVMDLGWDLPMTMMCEFMGVPHEDRQMMFELSTAAATPEGKTREEHQAATGGLVSYALDLAARKRKNPDDGLVSRYANGEIEGAQLNDLEIGIFFTTLSIASHETTRNTSNHFMRLLSLHPDQKALLLGDLDDLLPNAIEETLRHSPPVMQFRRTMAQDLELRGKKLRKGDKIYMSYVSANRDEDVFPEPDRYDITRENAREHLAFGSGNHFCLGAGLARMQLRVLFKEILTRLPDIHVVGPPERLTTVWFDAIQRMEVEFTPS
ncbi:MAG: cytochrome P450 [Myxococcota bacterium]|nr:cytochrome P450 [Myxococcota bacterium]